MRYKQIENMKLPVRKCYYVVKVSFCLMLVVLILSLFEQWRGKKRSVGAQVTDLSEEFEREIRDDESNIIPGLGEGGDAAHLFGEAKRLGEESEKKLAINVYLSDKIAYNRTLKDHRNPACKRVLYDAELPSASVILIFHNEPYSVVVRTIWSVLNSARRDQPWFAKAHFMEREMGKDRVLGYPGQDPASPFVYLKEIILVDDNSTLPELKGKLSHYIQTRLPPDLIKILRLPDRVGLTRARLAGARYATGDVLVFLDAHCEAQRDWLRPLLQRIKDSPHAVVVPIIDVIEASNFYYSVQDAVTFQGLMRARIRGARAARGDVLIFLDAHCEAGPDWLRPLLQRIAHKRDAVLTPLIDVIDQTTFQLEAAEQFQVGGFTFMGHFTWIDVPEREKKRRGSDIAPTWSPTMAGGLFAINRQYYWELGAYDEQMAGWGGENLEMSFRIWQCGGTLETIPCSRVGHVFRSFHPYGLPAHSDTHGINTARMAEVWMDEYAELFYLHRPDLRKSPKIGDVTHRKVLREKLKCKSFQWYLEHVYRDKFVPVRDVYGFGRIQNPSTGQCLDSLQREGEASPLGVYPCHKGLEATQYFALSLRGELRDEEKCAELQYTRSPSERDSSRRVLMVTCHGKLRGQRWRYLPSRQLRHEESGLCLSAPSAGSDVIARDCTSNPLQVWQIDFTEDNGFRINKEGEPSEQELRLQKLRGQRRISRSLMSYNETGQRRHHKKGKKKGRKGRKSKKGKKDKFILKLIRQVNNTEQHLEADLYCRHRRLFPNDSFVRDIVAVLNDRDIKVINNGRVFEKHKVTDLHNIQHKMVLPLRDSEPKKEVLIKKRKDRRKPDVQPVNMEAIDSVPNAESPGRPKMEEANIMRLNQENEKKIIIEDFVEVKPKNAPTDGPKRKRKRLRGKTVPLIPQGEEDAMKPMSMEDSPLDEQAMARTRDSASDEAKPLHRHAHVHLDIDNADNKVDNKLDDKVNNKLDDKVNVKDNKYAYKDVDDDDYREPTIERHEKEIDSLNKKINFKKVFDQVGNSIHKNVYSFDSSDSKKVETSKDFKSKVNGDTYKVYNDKVVYTDGPNRYKVSEEREDDGFDVKDASQRDEEQGDISPASLYHLVQDAGSETSPGITPHPRTHDMGSKTPQHPREHQLGSKSSQHLKSYMGSKSPQYSRETDPREKSSLHYHRVHKPESESAGSPQYPKANDVESEIPPGSSHYPRGQDSDPDSKGPVRVVMRSNLTFNLGDEFFNWKQAADDVANLLGELTIPGNTTKSSGEFDSKVEQDTVVTGKGRSEGGREQESGSSESTSEEK